MRDNLIRSKVCHVTSATRAADRRSDILDEEEETTKVVFSALTEISLPWDHLGC